MEKSKEIEFVKRENADGAETVAVKSGKKSRTKKIIIVLIIVAVLLFIAINLVRGVSSARGNHTFPYIGELYIEGTIGEDSTIYNQEWILNQIEAMKKSNLNKGLLLYINSPGGAVYQSDEIYSAIKDYQKETKRPVYSYYAEYAASGAYYISAGSDFIGANRFCTTGSIGVYYGPLMEMSGLLEKLGVKADIIKSGENKAMGSSYTPLTEEQRQIYQDQVNEIYDIFVGIVAEGRGMDDAYVRQIADGRAYTASQAVGNGLIDEICSLEDVENKIREKTGTHDLVTLQYHEEEPLVRRLIGVTDDIKELSDMKNKSDEQKLLEYIDKMYEKNSGFMMMLQR